MQVKDIMTSEPACCTPADTIRDAARLMKENDCGLIPVVDDQKNRRLVGVITDRDIAVRAVAQGKGPDTLVRDAMSDDLEAARPDDDLEQVQRIMGQHQVRRVPIIDENNRIVGIVSQADLARHDHAVSDRTVGRVVEQISEPGTRSS